MLPLLRRTLACAVLCATPALIQAQAYPRAGFRADLSTLSHGVSGQVTIVDADTLLVEHFFYDGGGARAFFRLGRDASEASFAVGFLQIPPELPGTRLVDATFTLQLPAGTNLDPYTAVSAWCVPFGFSMGKGTFEGPTCTPASMTTRNGRGLNTVVLRGTSQPVLGRDWGVTLDCSAHAPGLAIVAGFSMAVPGTVTRFGEVLVGGTQLFAVVVPHTSSTAIFSFPIPPRAALCGRTLSVQGACRGAPVPRLSNALDLMVGD